MRVHRGERSNRFCGPAALSLLSGRHVDECTEALRENRRERRPGRRHAIRGCRTMELLCVLQGWGRAFKNFRPSGPWSKPRGDGKWYLEYPTVAQVIRATRGRTPDQKFLLVQRGHFVVLRGNMIYDNHNPDGVFIRKYAHRRRRVTDVWEVL